jgi:hypothetical protein
VGKHTCENGHEWKSRFQPAPSELRCPECGEYAQPKLKARNAGPGLRAQAESPTVAAAHERFTELVTEWPCWAKAHRRDHRCWGPIDPHHLVPASWIKSTYGQLPSELLAEILYAPIIGAPLCRKAHEAVESRSLIIAWHELDDELKVFCRTLDERYPQLPSMLARLQLESPSESSGRAAA